MKYAAKSKKVIWNLFKIETLKLKPTSFLMDVILWMCKCEPWASEHEQLFLEYFTNIDKIFEEYYLTHRT